MIVTDLCRVFLYLLLITVGSIDAKVLQVIEDRSVLDGKQQLVVKFAATWCSTCQHIAEPFAAVSDEPEFQHIIFVHIDIERHEQVSKQHGVIGVPTIAYFDNGSKKGQVVGAKDLGSFKDHLRESIRAHFNMAADQTRLAAVAPVQEQEDNCEQQSDNIRTVLVWVWNGITHIVDDVATAFKWIFA